jgi:hypothetical protein
MARRIRWVALPCFAAFVVSELVAASVSPTGCLPFPDDDCVLGLPFWVQLMGVLSFGLGVVLLFVSNRIEP